MKPLSLLLLAILASAACAGEADWFGDGASGRWQEMLGAQEIGPAKDQPAAVEEPGRPSALGRKLQAGALSLLVPGAGQLLLNGDRAKGWLMVGGEVATWGAYLVFDRHGDGWVDDYEEYAGFHAGARGDHPDRFWQAVGRYDDSDAYFDSLLRDARAYGEDPPAPLAADEVWRWTDPSYQLQYRQLRANATRSYDRRDFMILVAVLHRAVSAFDAVRNAHVGGLDVQVDVSSLGKRPEARCGLAGRF